MEAHIALLSTPMAMSLEGKEKCETENVKQVESKHNRI